MNTKETQLVMNDDNIQYISLYNYLGQSVRGTDHGIKVSELAIQKGIKPRYELLPTEVQTDDYKSVATYPLYFLDEIFKPREQDLVRKDELFELSTRVHKLEKIIKELKNATNSNVNDADDLPF